MDITSALPLGAQTYFQLQLTSRRDSDFRLDTQHAPFARSYPLRTLSRVWSTTRDLLAIAVYSWSDASWESLRANRLELLFAPVFLPLL